MYAKPSPKVKGRFRRMPAVPLNWALRAEQRPCVRCTLREILRASRGQIGAEKGPTYDPLARRKIIDGIDTTYR